MDFFERKLPPGAAARDQARRRARAYVQIMRRSQAPRDGWLSRWQWRLYRSLPLHAPALFLLLLLAALCAAIYAWGAWGWLFLPVALLLLSLIPAGRRLLRMLALIRVACRAERVSSISDRWEMRRS